MQKASNVPVYPGDAYLAGAKILRQYGGPLPGVVVLIPGAGGAPSRLRYELWGGAKRRVVRSMPAGGFRRNPCAAGGPAPRVLPASFDTQGAGSVPRSDVGLAGAADEQGEERATRKSAPVLISVAEILASPAGEGRCVFDLDGTLVTAVILTQERLRRRDMGVGGDCSVVQAGPESLRAESRVPKGLIGKARRGAWPGGS